MARLKLPANITDKNISAGGNDYAVRDGHIEVTDAEDIAELKGRGFTDASAPKPAPANQPRG